MPNIKSAKKRVKQEKKRTTRNVARKSSVKTAVKKVRTALAQGQDAATLKDLLKDAEAKLARAAGKGLIHKKTASRKTSRLAKQIAETSSTKEAA